MGIFFEKPTKGPDVVGGMWPIKDRGTFWNRTGSTLNKGDVVTLAWRQGVASEIATNDANSYIPGASNDTIWNTVIYATSTTVQRGGPVGVVLGGPNGTSTSADNTEVVVQLFGIAEAYVSRSNTTSTNPGAPLTIFASNGALRGFTFDPVHLSNECSFASLIDYSNAALTTKRLKRVFLHQGLFSPAGGQAYT